MDVIWCCAFGYDLDIQNNPNNPYFYKCEDVMLDTVKLRIFNYIGG
jgi:hypothetical protein